MAEIEERLVELLNLATIEVDNNQKVSYLYEIKELAFTHGLIDRFFQDILAFQNGPKCPNVKKFVLSFIEAACKHDCKFVPKVILSLNLLLNDSNVEVLKRSIQAATQYYRALINYYQQPQVENIWPMWEEVEKYICGLLETTNNEGVKTQSIKFIETTVLMQTACDKFAGAGYEANLIDLMIEPIKLSDDLVLFNEDHKLRLVEAAKKRFEQLIVFHGTPHISSVNLMATTQSLVVLAKNRCRLFMKSVIQAIESLQSRLPPTLTESQVHSVKKFLKLQLIILLKHPYCMDMFQPQIVKLLQATGSKQPEIHKVINDFKLGSGIESQKRIKLEPKHLDLNKLTEELDEKEKREIVIDSIRRILREEKKNLIPPSQMDIKKKVLSTLAEQFHHTECSKIIEDYIFEDVKNRHEICYAIIKKHYDVAASRAAKRQIDLFKNQDLLKNYFDSFNSYLNRAMELKDSKEKEVILPKLYCLREEFYTLSNASEQGEPI